jgi:DNA-binding response OmpR family regulator
MVAKIKKILIVEDEKNILDLIVSMFDGLSEYYTFSALDGEQALHIAYMINPDVILLDIQLPKMSGYEVCELIKSRSAKTKILMLSGLAQYCDKEKAREVGADGFIAKPFSSTELLAKVDELLGG